MTTTTKAVNYTVEQTAALIDAYTNGRTVEMLAVEFGKSVRSIVAKLSREKVYQKKAYVTKSGETVVKKDELADKLALKFGFTEAETESLTKANKTALKKILDKFEEL
jgi:hypothetical protein